MVDKDIPNFVHVDIPAFNENISDIKDEPCMELSGEEAKIKLELFQDLDGGRNGLKINEVDLVKSEFVDDFDTVNPVNIGDNSTLKFEESIFSILDTNYKECESTETTISAPIISQKTENNGNLKKHKRANLVPKLGCLEQITLKKLFKCTFCDYSSENLGTVKAHIRVFCGQKLLKCSHCEYTVAHSGPSHIRTHTSHKLFKCKICNCYSAEQWKIHKSHMTTHTRQKAFKYNSCDFSTTHSGTLLLHSKTHTGYKVFKCTVCDYSATQSDVLNTHMRTHTRQKPFHCSVCDYSTAYAGALTNHIRTHTGQKPFKCTVCGYSATRADYVRKHMTTHPRVELIKSITTR